MALSICSAIYNGMSGTIWMRASRKGATDAVVRLCVEMAVSVV